MTQQRPALNWRYFDADSLGDATAFARKIGNVAVMQSSVGRHSMLVMCANNTSLRLAIDALRLGRDIIPAACMQDKAWWLHGTDALVAEDMCRAMEATRLATKRAP